MSSTPVDAPEPAAAAKARPRIRRRAPLLALASAIGVAASGVPLGLLWYAIAPRVPAIMTQDGPVPADAEPEQFIADDGWFILLGVVAGVVAASSVWALVRRHRGPLLLVALVVGSMASGILAAWLGHKIGMSQYRSATRDAKVGSLVEWPATVRTTYVGLWYGVLPRIEGAVLTQAIAAVATYTLLAGFHPTPSLESPVPEGTLAPDAPLSWGSTGSPTPPGALAPPAPGRAGPPPE